MKKLIFMDGNVNFTKIKNAHFIKVIRKVQNIWVIIQSIMLFSTNKNKTVKKIKDMFLVVQIKKLVSFINKKLTEY